MKFLVSGFTTGRGFGGRSGPGGKKPKKFNFKINKALGKFFFFFITFLFLAVVSFFSGFFGGRFNAYLNKSDSGADSTRIGDGLTPIGPEANAVNGFDVESLVAKVMPSVVGVVAPIRKKMPSWEIDNEGRFPLFPFPFRIRSSVFCAGGRRLPENGSFGSGFFVNVDGEKYVITNHHVIKDFIEGEPSDDPARNSVYIVFKNNISNLKSASVVGYDVDLDVAVLKLVDYDTSKVSCLEFVGPNAIKVGGLAIAIGNPMSLKYYTVTRGIVSCLRKMNFDAGGEVPVVQTDAAINRGNSGGPLINNKGQVIGVNTCKLADSQSEGIAFAVEGSAVHKKVCEIVRKGTKNNGVAYPGLGVAVCDDDSYLAKYFGVVISNVVKQSPADKAGLKVGDVIVGIDGVKVNNFAEWRQELRKKKAGSEIVLEIIRRGEMLKIKVMVV